MTNIESDDILEIWTMNDHVPNAANRRNSHERSSRYWFTQLIGSFVSIILSTAMIVVGSINASECTNRPMIPTYLIGNELTFELQQKLSTFLELVMGSLLMTAGLILIIQSIVWITCREKTLALESLLFRFDIFVVYFVQFFISFLCILWSMVGSVYVVG